MKCQNCQAVLSGEPTCPACGTLYTVSSSGASIPSVVVELEARLARALEGRYELRGLLGHGGMGAVFLAAELSLDRLVAIKVLPPSLSMDEELLGRFLREAKTAARLDHRGIVPIYAVEAVDGLHLYVMKFIPGTDLTDEIGPGGMAVEQARRLIWESAVALGHAHHRGVIHRDVKPANIMLDPSGRAMLTDFGIAKAVRGGPAATAMTSTGQMIGTPQYMSPEQMEGREVDGRSDQYALGMVAWHVLAGRQPFEHGSVAALLVKQLSQYPESLAALRPEVPDAMVAAIERAIRKDPDERFETMEDFARAFWPEQAGAVDGGRPPSTASTASGRGAAPGGPRFGPGGGGRRWLGLVAGVIVLGVAAYGGFTGRDGGADPVALPEVPTPAPVGALEEAARTDPAAGGGTRAGDAETDGASDGDGAVSGSGGSAVGVSTRQGPDDGDAGEESQGAEPTSASASTATAAAPDDPPDEGFLTLGTRPWAYVTIDGIDIPDPTPLNRMPLAPGEHVIQIRREGYRTIVDTILISAGNATTRSYPLIPN